MPSYNFLYTFMIRALLAVVCVFALSSCTEVERGAHRSFSNANSVIRNSRSTIWGPGDNGHALRQQENEDEELVQP